MTHPPSPSPRIDRRRLLGKAGIGVAGAAGVAGVAWASARQRGTTAEHGANGTPPPAPLEDSGTLSVSTGGWATDFSRSSVPLDEILPGGPPRDGIPPIDDPRTISIADADGWLDPAEPVIALAEDQPDGSRVARAYPLQIMVWHEIVNDMLGGRPRLVTFCPLCNTAIAFDRRLEPDGPVYDFGTTGNLRHSDLVMWDRQTESWWQQITGEAIVGELTGRSLTPLPAQILGWGAFKSSYPDGDVLSRETGFGRSYGENPYPGYDDVDSSPFLFDGDPDGRLAAMERVVGVTIGPDAAAYPLGDLAAASLAQDTLGGRPIVVLFAAGARSALDTAEIAAGRDVGQAGVFLRTLDGEMLSFTAGEDGRFVDAGTGSHWDVTGVAVRGPLLGRRLEALPHTVVFWFAWAAFQPETRLWAP